jgi:rhamnopyranosyl-N-acetylglucosaminyl-diphospho-decaprenol beta-1,3/1,4-galactofuranosyltransferase
MEQSSIETHAGLIAAVIVSRDRYDELEKTVIAVLTQTGAADVLVFIIDSSKDDRAIRERFSSQKNIILVRSSVNLGGAGGFAYGIMNALASGAEWVWLMDDDGRPCQDDTLERLLFAAKTNGLNAVAPIVLDPNDLSKFSFPYRTGSRYAFRRYEVPVDALMNSTAHLFNGLLIQASALFKVGLPDIRLFIRGDEVDFLYRMRSAKLRFATTASAKFTHPSGEGELHPIFGGLLHAIYPQPMWKRRIQYRNRGYYLTRHRNVLILAVDLIRYPYFFLVTRRFDLTGLRDWIGCTWAGILGRVEASSILAGADQKISVAPRDSVTTVELVS